jgi:MinD superfamily P-loop ATPase
MKEIVILSGKGGTGKTSIAGSFAVLANHNLLADCDVDAADLHLLLNPSQKEEIEFWSGKYAFINNQSCTQCDLCSDICRFDAIRDYKVNPVSCEGCGFCSLVCPSSAITMRDNLSGHLYISDTVYGPLVHAKLGIAQENSGKLVALVRQTARKMAKESNYDLLITDGPPGIGCPVISSLSGASLALLVTEPTLSGMHDLERIIGVCHHFGVPAICCINKYDINEENSSSIEQYCSSQNVPVSAKIPFDNAVTEALVNGVPVVTHSQSKAAKEIEALWAKVMLRLND